jgi:D-alanyl-D-alanine dipeptidase
MWEAVRGTELQPYVADPGRASLHNYGMAVDVTLADAAGEALDMGGDFDELGAIAEPRREPELLRSGRLTLEQVDRRRLLRAAMLDAGFRPLSIEWWHFEACGKETARARYTLIE